MISPIPNIRKAYAPRHCVRQVQIYKRCLLGNDQDKGKCKPEAESILAICPAFALDQMKESNYGRLKQEALDDQKYRRAMAVP